MIPRIVHVASGREWRGGQNQVWLLARALERTGAVRQVVVTSTGSELERRLAASGVPVHPTGWRAALDPRALWATAREARREPAILHAHDAHALTLAGLASSISASRLLATRRLDFHLRRPGYWVRAERVIAISGAVRKVLVEDGVDSARITVIHSGIALNEVREIRPLAIRTRLALPVRAVLAVTVGALVPHKDQATLVSAASLLRTRLPDLHWLIAGEGELRGSLQRQIAELGLEGRVHLLGHVPEAVRLIAEASLYVHSSFEEGLGTTILDAMALGVPVVATEAGGVPEMIGGGAGLLAPRRDPAALAGAMLRMMTDRQLAARSVARATIEVQRFSDSGMADRMLSVYRSLVSVP